MQNSIIVMDSDFLSNWFLSKTLNDLGYRVIRVSDMNTLLKRLAVERYHAVVVRVDNTDVREQTAIEVVRAAHPDARVIAYAPHAGKSLRDEFERENVQYFLHPFRTNEIRRVMA